MTELPLSVYVTVGALVVMEIVRCAIAALQFTGRLGVPRTSQELAQASVAEVLYFLTVITMTVYVINEVSA
jgi:hypothetical protein